MLFQVIDTGVGLKGMDYRTLFDPLKMEGKWFLCISFTMTAELAKSVPVGSQYVVIWLHCYHRLVAWNVQYL